MSTVCINGETTKSTDFTRDVTTEWIMSNYDIRTVLKRAMLLDKLKIACDKSRDWRNSKSRVKNEVESRDWNAVMTTYETTQQTAQETTQQTTWNAGHWEIGTKEMP